MSKPKDPQPFHYFATTAAVWVRDTNLLHAIERAKRADGGISKGCTVWRVSRPHPEQGGEPYDINFFTPQVLPAELEEIDFVYFRAADEKHDPSDLARARSAVCVPGHTGD